MNYLSSVKFDFFSFSHQENNNIASINFFLRKITNSNWYHAIMPITKIAIIKRIGKNDTMIFNRYNKWPMNGSRVTESSTFIIDKIENS